MNKEKKVNSSESPESPNTSPNISPESPKTSPNISPESPKTSPNISPESPKTSPNVSLESPKIIGIIDASPSEPPKVPKNKRKQSPNQLANLEKGRKSNLEKESKVNISPMKKTKYFIYAGLICGALVLVLAFLKFRNKSELEEDIKEVEDTDPLTLEQLQRLQKIQEAGDKFGHFE